MVVHQLPKLAIGVQFPLLAPVNAYAGTQELHDYQKLFLYHMSICNCSQYVFPKVSLSSALFSSKSLRAILNTKNG